MNNRARGVVREFVHGVIHLWWIFVIVMPLTAFGLYLAIDHANANQQRSQARANRLFRQSQIESNRKFRQAIEISTRQSVYSINKSVCTLRPFLEAALKARLAAVRDAKSEADRKLNRQAAETYTKLIDSQVTVPSDFDCSTLPKKPPKP